MLGVSTRCSDPGRKPGVNKVCRQGVLTPGASPGLIRAVRIPISNQNQADRIKKPWTEPPEATGPPEAAEPPDLAPPTPRNDIRSSQGPLAQRLEQRTHNP